MCHDGSLQGRVEVGPQRVRLHLARGDEPDPLPSPPRAGLSMQSKVIWNAPDKDHTQAIP